jgi:starvation-inducible outer membrane lipoprotein
MRHLILLSVLALTGCVSIPLPPSGENAGKYGYVQIGYVPNLFATPTLPQPTSTK